MIAVMKCEPSTSPTQRRMASVIRSGRSARMIMSCRKPERRFHSCGSGCVSGCSCSTHSFHLVRVRVRVRARIRVRVRVRVRASVRIRVREAIRVSRNWC